MLKKLTKIGMFIGLLALATTGFAQDEAKTAQQPFPRYGFWSNWSIGVAPMITKDLGPADQLKDFTFGQGLNVGAELRFTKQLNYKWKYRLLVNVPGFLNEDKDSTDAVTGFDRYGLLMNGFSFNLCKWFYVYADGGLGVRNETFAMGLAADLGLGLNFDFGSRDQHEIYIEAGIDNYSDITRDFQYNCASVKLGYAYNFGLTKVDQELAAQKSLLTQENFDALNSQIAGLEDQLAACKANEQRLENRVAELENELANAKNNNCAKADSLQRLLDQMRADQGKYYGLPFSIQFDNDSYRIKSSEQGKLKAIAQIMKDNEDANFNLVGYCDYTGSDEYNQKLSEKRAEAVKKQLVDKYGIDENRLSTSGKGKSEPYGDAKLSINRRVSFFRAM